MSCKARYPDLTDCTLFPSRGSGTIRIKSNAKYFITDWLWSLSVVFVQNENSPPDPDQTLTQIFSVGLENIWAEAASSLPSQARLPRYLHIHHQFSLVVGVCKHGYCGGGMASLYSIKTSDERISNIMKYWGGLAVYWYSTTQHRTTPTHVCQHIFSRGVNGTSQNFTVPLRGLN